MISREGILKINNTYTKNIKREKTENKFITYRNIVTLIISILSALCVFFSSSLPFVFGLSAFIIHKKELNKIPLVAIIILTVFTLNISSAIIFYKLFICSLCTYAVSTLTY